MSAGTGERAFSEKALHVGVLRAATDDDSAVRFSRRGNEATAWITTSPETPQERIDEALSGRLVGARKARAVLEYLAQGYELTPAADGLLDRFDEGCPGCPIQSFWGMVDHERLRYFPKGKGTS